MDVTCNRCGTDYEFDETLLSARGTTVKCTSCGHLFKVYRGGNPEQTPTDDSRPWLLRRGNGDVEPLVSLGDLTRMIARAEITPDDEISRTGQAWKKLGDIAELQSFFANPKRAQAALSATPPLGLESPVATAPSNRPGRPDAPLPIGVGSSPPVSRTEVTQPGVEMPKPTIRVSEPPTGASTPRHAREATPSQPLEPASELPTPTINIDEPPGQEHTPRERPSARTRKSAAPREPSRPPTTPVPSRPPPGAPRASLPPLPPAPPVPSSVSGAHAPVPTLAEEIREPKAKGFPWGRMALLLALVGLGMGAYAWGSRLMQPKPPVSATAAFISRGDDALASHDLRRFPDAVTDYTKALAFNEHDVAALTRLSRTHAIWAEALESVALWDTMRAEESRVERKRQIAAARKHAEQAVRVAPNALETEVAMVDALRLDGAITAARERLKRIGEPATTSGAETLRVAALLAAAESDGDLSKAVELARRAAQRDPALIRNKLMLAKLLLATGDVSDAREQVRDVLNKHPAHRLAGMLLSAIEAKAVAEQATSSAAVADAGVDAAIPPQPDAQPAVGVAQAQNEAALPTTFEELVRRGDSLLERGAIRGAKEAFEKALALRPGAAPAMTGLGYVALERNDAAGAVRLFTPASNAGFGDAFIGLGDAYRQLGRHAEALRAYDSYLNRFPSGPRASIARRQTERLREQVRRSSDNNGHGPITTPSGLPALNDTGETP